MNRCLYCYQELAEGEIDFHPRCAKKIFGSKTAPLLPYTQVDIKQLAEEVVRSQTTLTGVQAKLSLDISSSAGEPKRFTIVGLWGRYILKPQIERFNHLPEVEDLTMHLAELAKINVVPHSLVRFTDGELLYRCFIDLTSMLFCQLQYDALLEKCGTHRQTVIAQVSSSMAPDTLPVAIKSSGKLPDDKLLSKVSNN